MEILNLGGGTGSVRLLLAHGAGAPMTSPFLEEICHLLAQRGVATSRFEFAYMAERRRNGARRPPPKIPLLQAEFIAAIEALRGSMQPDQRVFIGGKSMGGRVASLVADAEFSAGHISGLVCLGYPFHPPKKPDVLRTAHLETLACPALIVQGERDPFGTRDDVAGLKLSARIEIVWIADGDHDFKPRARSGETLGGNMEAAADAVARYALSAE